MFVSKQTDIQIGSLNRKFVPVKGKPVNISLADHTISMFIIALHWH